jgi:hypothetical protein
MEVAKRTKECAFDVTPMNGICVDSTTVKDISAFATNSKGITASDPINVYKKLKKVIGCTSDACVLTNKEVRETIGSARANKQLEMRIKPSGPFNNTEWFSNEHIDSVLDQIERLYKKKNFLHVDFQMRDFEAVGSALARMDLADAYRNGTRCFGVVFNTDTSNGRGQHWFAVFGDFSAEPFSIEYFNSTGNHPLPEIESWGTRTANHLTKTLGKKTSFVQVTDISNQTDSHSCGSYSLFYIISRLEGVDYEFFTKNKIGDAQMHEFRYNIFRHD